MAEEASHPGPEPSSELSQLSDITVTDPYHLGEQMEVVDDGDDRDDRDSQDDDDDDADADADADTSTNTNASTDIVLETTTCWRKLRRSSRYRVRQGTDRARDYNMASFLREWIKDGRRARKLRDALLDPTIRKGLESSGIHIFDGKKEEPVIEMRKEMQALLVEPPFEQFKPYQGAGPRGQVASTIADVCDTSGLETTLSQVWPTLKSRAPTMVTFLSQALQNQFSSKDSVLQTSVDEAQSGQICLLASLLLRGYARNTSQFLREVLGLYMLANGTPRRVIETLSQLGVIVSYSSLNRLLSDMEQKAKENIKRAAHDPNGIIVYDNFNFLNRIRELAGGKQDQFVNLTTSCLVACPELNGPLNQSSLNLTQPFTKPMVVAHLLPRKPTFNVASKWLLKHALMKVFRRRDINTDMPVVQRVSYLNSPFLQLGAVFEDEGTISGVYKLHEEIWHRRLGFKEYDERLTLVYGDMKTTSFIRRIKQSQLEASDLWEQKKWMLPIPAFFHIELNYIEMLFRVFWDTGNTSMLSSAVISADVAFFQRTKHISKKSIKYHQVLPLLMHGYTARILAFVIHHLVDRDSLPGSLNIDTVKEAMAALNLEVLEDILERIWATVFSHKGWTGRYDDDQEPGCIDTEFRSHCRLMQCVEVLLIFHEAVRHGDFGLLRDIIPMLPILFWGGKSSNYGPEMLYFSWLLHPNVVPDENLRDAFLKGGLIRCTTTGSQYKAIDLLLEHINATYALDIKHNKNSTHDIHATFSRLALNSSYLAVIRKSVESVFGGHQKGTHTPGDPTTDVIAYAIKLYNDGMTRRHTAVRPNAWDVPDLYERGQKTLLEKLSDFNEVVPEPKDASDQRRMPGTDEGGTQDNELDWADEGDRLFDVGDDDMWQHSLADLGLTV